MASSNLQARCSIHDWDSIPIHSKSGSGTLGRSKRVILYLGSTKDLWLTFSGCRNTALEGFRDSDWAGQPHRHLISRYSFHMGMGSITWSSKKQYIVVLLSTEAEYITQTHVVKEAMYLCMFIWEIVRLDKPVAPNCNNQGATKR